MTDENDLTFPTHSFRALYERVLGWQASLIARGIDGDELLTQLESMAACHRFCAYSQEEDEPKFQRLRDSKAAGVWSDLHQAEAVLLNLRVDQRIRLIEEAQRIYELIALRYG